MGRLKPKPTSRLELKLGAKPVIGLVFVAQFASGALKYLDQHWDN